VNDRNPAAAGPAAATTRVDVGCYTNRSPIGVHTFDLVGLPDQPALAPRAHLEGVDHPSYVVAHPTAPVRYLVSEVTEGEIVVCADDEGSLTVVQRVPSHGAAPCHLATDGQLVAVANYVSGTAAAWSLTPDGRIDALVWTAEHEGTGPHPRQEAPHAHGVVLDPRRPSIHVVDLGTDVIARYDATAGAAGFRLADQVAMAPGAGPRHLVLHPARPVAYAVCELDSTLVTLDVDETTGALRPRTTISTLPPGHADDSIAAAIRLHPDGHHLFVTNRGHDSIAVFDTSTTSDSPVLLGHVATGGSGPRDLAIDPTGRLLLVANQHGGTVTGFDLGDGSGLPRPLGVLAEVDEPVCLLISAVAP
jgi:6-phosphogluconolactonase